MEKDSKRFGFGILFNKFRQLAQIITIPKACKGSELGLPPFGGELAFLWWAHYPCCKCQSECAEMTQSPKIAPSSSV
jgi:hypothetical protein